MTNAMLIGWRNATVTDVRGLTISKATGNLNFVKFFVEVEDPQPYTATELCEPNLLPGRKLYRWCRVCGVPLSAIDNTINPVLFRSKKIRAKIAQNGDYYNILDIKTIDAK